jgi:tetratricopeptide (TPR) repeat protein
MKKHTKRWALSTLFVLLCLLVACGNPNQEKLKHVARGQQYLKDKRYAEARIEFRSALQLDKKLAAAQFGLGEASLALGYVQEAAEGYYEALRLDPQNLEARVRVGGLLLQYATDESIKEAERLANDVLQKDGNYVAGQVLKAKVRAAQKNWDEAQQEFQRALELAPEDIETELSLARYYDQRAQAEPARAAEWRAQAETIFRQIIAKHPQAASARLAFGDFLFAHDRAADAEQQLLQAHQIDPTDKLVLVALRRFYETQERYDEAEKYLVKLVELDPDKIAGRAQIIDLHARTGRIQQAVGEYQELIKTDPKYLRGYARLAELLLEMGDVGGATAQVEAALKQNSQDTDALLMRGRLRTLNGQYREAIGDLEQVLRLEPTSPAALYYAADAHLQNNDATQARLLVGRLLGFYPRNPMGMLMTVRIQLSENRNAEAEKTATQIIENITQLKANDEALRAARIPADTLPDWESKAYVSRAVARIPQRNLAGAQSDLEKAMQIDPRNAEPHLNLAALHLLRGDLASAQRAAERAVELEPGDVAAVTTAVNVYIQQRNFPTAHARLDQLLHAQPKQLALQELKARVYVAQGEGAQAEKILRQVLQADPNYLNAYFVLSDYYQSSQQRTEQAINELNDLIRRRPDNAQQVAQAHLFIGMLEEGRGNFDAAVQHYERMLSFDQRSLGAAIALNNLAWLYADKGKGNLDKATDHARNAIGIAPEANFFDTLGYAYYKKRQYEVAIEQFNKAISRRPASAAYHLHLARAYRDNGDSQQARQAYERALQLGGVNFSEAGQVRQELAALRKT